MKKMGLAWGAVVAAVACGTAAQAAPKAAGAGAAGVTGSAGAGATAPSSGAMIAPGPSAPLVPPASVAPESPSAPPPDVEAPPAPDAAAQAEAEAEAREEAKEREAARKRVRRRRAQLEAEAEAEAEDEAEEAKHRTEVERPRSRLGDWRLVGPHFLISAERMTNVLGWSSTETVPLMSINGFPTSSTAERERAGADVSFMGSGHSTNPFSIPRLGFDGMFANGLTLGGSISYLVASSEHQAFTTFNGTSTVTVKDPTVSTFVLAPRLGVMIQASRILGVWLRGGISRISMSTEAYGVDPDTGEQLSTSRTSTLTMVDVTLDPQLVFTPVPHVGLTLGAALDIGVSGGYEDADGSQERDFTQSSYGVTGGLVAIF